MGHILRKVCIGFCSKTFLFFTGCCIEISGNDLLDNDKLPGNEQVAWDLRQHCYHRYSGDMYILCSCTKNICVPRNLFIICHGEHTSFGFVPRQA